MRERIWQKFHPLFGPDLKVGFETTFPKGAVLDLDPLYEKSGLVHDPPNETTIRVYEPARVFGSCCDGRAADVLFVPVPRKGALFRRLMFVRKIEGATRQPRRWVIAARHGEVAPFGFDSSWNSKSQRYLPLAYPGLSEHFVPVYVKIQNGKEGSFVYLELWAWNECEGKNVVVQARCVYEDGVPEHLLLATPWKKVEKASVIAIA